MSNPNQAPPTDANIARGRKIFLGIILVFVVVEAAALTISMTESDIVRVILGLGLLYAAWMGQQWAVAVVALGCPISALLSFVLALDSGNPFAIVAGTLLAALYGGIFLLFLKSENLNAFFRHQATVAATPPSDD